MNWRRVMEELEDTRCFGMHTSLRPANRSDKQKLPNQSGSGVSPLNLDPAEIDPRALHGGGTLRCNKCTKCGNASVSTKMSPINLLSKSRSSKGLAAMHLFLAWRLQ